MKYIDVVRLKADIERLKGQLIRGACAAQIEMETNCKDEAYNEVLAFLDSLQQEQPSLPDLDEAARDIVIKMHPCLKDCTILGDRLTRGQLMALVKAGAEWAMQQLKGE